MKEHYCPYCRAWINETVHRQHHHNDLDEPDEIRDWRVRLNGVVYEDEDELWKFLLQQAKLKASHGKTITPIPIQIDEALLAFEFAKAKDGGNHG